MVMSGKILWISLFAIVQISVVLCRSTEIPQDETTEGTVESINYAAIGKLLEENNFTDDNGVPIPRNAALSSRVLYGENIDEESFRDAHNKTLLNAAAIVIIVVGVAFLLFCFLGCILFCRCKKEPRRGFTVCTNTGEITGGIQNPGFSMQGYPGTTQPIQQYPPSQQQNIYPPTYYPTK